MNDALGHANLELDELLQIWQEKYLPNVLTQAIALDRQLLIVGEKCHAHDTPLPVLGFDPSERPGEFATVSERFIAKLGRNSSIGHSEAEGLDVRAYAPLEAREMEVFEFLLEPALKLILVWEASHVLAILSTEEG